MTITTEETRRLQDQFKELAMTHLKRILGSRAEEFNPVYMFMQLQEDRSPTFRYIKKDDKFIELTLHSQDSFLRLNGNHISLGELCLRMGWTDEN